MNSTHWTTQPTTDQQQLSLYQLETKKQPSFHAAWSVVIIFLFNKNAFSSMGQKKQPLDAIGRAHSQSENQSV